ncbi:multicopper oxidase domain-containing protein [Paracrocinitomix mangrovi]|uniref:multicopper oxidase domain-containing protein n=1 Tax=Paracrocinitomix mangrovi TaxID=2862509 RepID=UPI001C8DF997|nr:multicopper oxidase domain-containing protein [Paracrocinitomix mangrovi]UKN02341.1 multicopper oxidase domain-containing protein [Paracrocinitomix mangrovi]
MKKSTLLFALFAAQLSFSQNPLNIPPLLSGNSMTLTLQEGTTDFYNGVTTNTMGANGSLLGPTLLLKKDSAVSLVVENQLQESTTIHWHGLHVSAENDGGPHNIIAPGSSWNPQFTVLDKAGVYWYHPHLHMMTNQHVSKGIAGMIIVQDAEEQSLGLPNDYGVDDFPLVLQTKAFDGTGQIEINTNLDTSVMVNGTVDAVTDLPAQVVRMRMLNGASERVMEIGFSDNRSFELIGTDGGLLTAPVTLTRYRLAPGQRIDILLDLTGDVGQNFQLMSFASELPSAIYGAAQPGMGPGATSSLVGYTSNPLNGADYSFLDINVVAQNGNPVTTIPSALASFTPLQEGSADVNRTITFTSAGTMGDLNGPFLFNGTSFDMNVINYYIQLDDIEIWTLENQTPISHPFHIHDVQFFILDINGNPPPPELQGYHDVILVPGGMGNARFIALFNDHESDSLPYMYHCHMLTHEDGGMMGQFMVNSIVENIDEESSKNTSKAFPNPSSSGEFTVVSDLLIQQYSVFSADGKLIQEENIENLQQLNIKLNQSGIYILQISGDGWTEQHRLIID